MTADTNINYNSSGGAVNTVADSEIEVEKIPLRLYIRAEERVKAASGMKTIEQAINELREEAREEYPKTVQKVAEEEEGPHTEPERSSLVPPTKEEERPHVRRVDRALAAHIKRARKLYRSGGANKMIDDAQFYEMFRLANHSPDEPKEEFYSMVEDLKRKKLL